MQNPTATSERPPLVHVAAALRRHIDSILRDWAACGEADAASARQRLDARNLLENLALRLEQPDAQLAAAPPPAIGGTAPSAAGMIRTFGALRQLVIEHLAEQIGREIRVSEIAAIDESFDELAAEAIAATIDARLDEYRLGDDLQARYMSFLSHDLRGSLNGLMLMLEVMRRELSPHQQFAETVGDIEVMRKSVQGVVGNMERYVQADRLRRGKVAINIQAVQLGSIISTAISHVSEEAREKQVEVMVDADDRIMVQTDAELARLALVNLLENAVRHGGPGTVRISARTAQGACTVSVVDHGAGMPPDRLANLLNPAHRAQIKEKGIGMIIAHYAARAAGGRIEADCATGGGCTFRLILKASP
jgi:signal transduction histidine kinase